MAEIYVQSSSALQQIIEQLRNLNNEFRIRADDIRTEQNTLTTKWEGDASEAFQENFRKEEPNFATFMEAIEEYIQGLMEILSQYEATEEKNKVIAST